MLASIFGKVTSSLGKTFVFAGLLPSGVLLLVVLLYFTPFAVLARIEQDLLAKPDSWKSLAWLGCIWLAIGFLLYSLRAPILSLFQLAPSSAVGRRVLFRRIAKRERLKRARIEQERVITAINWLTNLGLDRAEIGDIPFWLARSYQGHERAIQQSRAGRERLLQVDRTVGDVLTLTVDASDAIAAGIFALFQLAKYRRDPDVELAISAEIAGWRFAFASREARAIMAFVRQDTERKVARAFRASSRYGEGPYIFPTRIGNLIAALDDYGLKRYGIDTATFWDRLWWVLPKDVKAEVSDARLALEALLNLLIALFLALATIAGSQVAVCGFKSPLFGTCDGTRAVIFLVAAGILVLLVYRGAAFALEVLSIKMTSLIDMYRLAALGQIGFVPKTVGQERSIYKKLKGLFVQAAELDDDLELSIVSKTESKEQKSEDKDEKPKEEKEEGGGDAEGGVAEESDDEAEEGAPPEGQDASPARRPEQGTITA